MKRKKYDERDYVVTEVMGEERAFVLNMITNVFSVLVASDDRGTGFPIWGESKAKLMELAYVLAKERVFIHHPTGTPASIKEVATWLCKALHCDVPRNIYEAASRTRLRGRRTVVDYYAMLWREAHVTPAISLLWAKPIQFPKIHNYKEAFDSPYFRDLHRTRQHKA